MIKPRPPPMTRPRIPPIRMPRPPPITMPISAATIMITSMGPVSIPAATRIRAMIVATTIPIIAPMIAPSNIPATAQIIMIKPNIARSTIPPMTIPAASPRETPKTRPNNPSIMPPKIINSGAERSRSMGKRPIVTASPRARMKP